MKSSSIKSKRHSMATIGQEPQPILPARNPHHEKSNSFMKPWETEDEPQIYSNYKISQYNHETKGPYLHRNKSELPPVLTKSPHAQSAVNLGSHNKSPLRNSITQEKETTTSKSKRVKKVNTEVFSIIEFQKTYEEREMNPEQSVYDYWKNSEKMNSTPQKPKFFLKTEQGQVKIIENPSGLQSRKSPINIPNLEEMNNEAETPRKKLFILTKKSSVPTLGLESENISLDISPLQASPMRKRAEPFSRQSRRKSSDNSTGRITTAQVETNFVPYEIRKNSNPKKNSSKRRTTPNKPATKINLLDTAKNENGRAVILPTLVNSHGLMNTTMESDQEEEEKKIGNLISGNTSFTLKNNTNNNTIDNGDKMFREEEEKLDITQGTLADILIRTEGPEIRKLKTKNLGSEKIIRPKNNLEVEQEIFESRNRLVPHPKGNNFAYMYRRAQKKRKAFDKAETQKMILRHHPTSEDQIKPLIEPPSPKKFVSQYERLMKLKAKFEEVNHNHVELPTKAKILNRGTTRNAGGDAPLLRNIKKQIDILSKEEGSTMNLGNRMKIKTNEQMFGMSGSRSKERFSFKDIVTTANNLAGRKLTPLFSLVSHTFDQS